jgi:hypothetical protein
MPNIYDVPIEEGRFPGDFNLDKKRLIRSPGYKKVSYRVKLDRRSAEDRATFSRLLNDGAIDVMGYQWQVLEGFLPGMKNQAAQDAFEALKTATKQRAKAVKAAKDAQRDFHTADAGVRSNSDPEQFKELNKQRIQAQQELESGDLFAETVGRHLEQKRRDFFAILDSIKKEKVAEVLAAIEPITEEYTKAARALASYWKKEGAPLLEKLSNLDRRYPNQIYFQQLSMGDLQLRELKTLRGYPVIHYDKIKKLFSFKFEVIE